MSIFRQFQGFSRHRRVTSDLTGIRGSNTTVMAGDATVVRVVVVVVVDCGLTSHSAIFQLYSDGTDVQISKF